ncbi:hypothetical protein ASD19_04590 [Microbacterium sp. Root53]|uniref:DUF4349 domain-containing protein n=1 Tax=Microbacterium sp. Root53 TaxID=1736553 RepID=UPI0006F3F9A8|nr:DUF4349 domain-containing protein [Microbacterium sp. Root53]KQY99174.1 hypothetical protein ASD19_04590 [Microbacterium sp. Root53]
MSENETRRDDVLPEVSDETLARIETRVFDAIGRERREVRSGARRRRRVWQGVGAAAAIVAVAAVISPAVLQGIGGAGSGADSGVTLSRDGAESGGGESGAVPEGAPAPDAGTAEDSAVRPGAADDAGEVAREVIRTGSATIVVDDVSAAADEISALATEFDGWVESLSIGEDATRTTEDGVVTEYIPVPPNGGWVSIRVPADRLDAVMARLDDVGEVTGTRVGTEDVSTVTRDLRARIDAARASVERLTALLEQSGSVADLVEVEAQLSARQAELESLEQQLEYYESQVAMSTLSVTLTEEAPPVEPDPAGFGDGLEAGWNGLLATLNGIVIALGFLLPWLAVIGLAWLIVWAILRAARSRRGARVEEAGD